MPQTEYTIIELLSISNSLIKFYGTEAGLFFAILAFFWKNKKLSEHKKWILLSLLCAIISIVFIGLVYYDNELLYLYETNGFLQEKRLFFRMSLLFGFLGIFFVPFSFLALYAKTKSFRSRKIFRHYFNLYVRNKANNDAYITSMQPRSVTTLFGKKVSSTIKDIIKDGCSFLIISDEISGEYVKNRVMKFLIEGLTNNETVDYVTVDSHPFAVKQNLDNCAKENGINLNHFAKDDFLIIDSFSSNYGYDEDVLMKNSRDIFGEIKILKAKSLIDIHSAAMDAWYIHKKRLLNNTGKLLRRPHRMVYDHLSVLSNKTTNENLLEYFTHLISSEKSYGMITIIIEYSSTDEKILNQLKQLSDCVLYTTSYQDNPYFEIKKIKNIRIKSSRNRI